MVILRPFRPARTPGSIVHAVLALCLGLILLGPAALSGQTGTQSVDPPAGQGPDPVADPAPDTPPTTRADLPPQISNEKLYEQSLNAAQKALAFYGEYDDPEAARRVQDIGYRLAAVSDYRQFPFTFYLVDMPVPNAFALPGGQIFVTRGMLDLGLDDHMLANLLGHEVAHVVYEHGQRMQRRATLLNILSQAALLGVMIGVDNDPAASTSSVYGPNDNRKGSLVQGAAASGIVFTELLMRKFSRGFEDEADIEGQRLAAAAGFDPDGARALWALMNEKLPPNQDYGYWRTHPFSDTRQRAASVRARDLRVHPATGSDGYRRGIQSVLLDFRDGLEEDDALTEPPPPRRDPNDRTPTDRDDRRSPPPDPMAERTRPVWQTDLRVFLERSALAAWPRGSTADGLRLAHLHRLRDRELERDEVARDYGELLATYGAEIDAVRALTPESELIAVLETESEELRRQAEAVFPQAVEIWESGVYQTPFLETFLSNWPEAEQVPDVALALAHAYSRSRRESQAVKYYLRAREAGPETEAGRRALRGLRNLTPHLEELVGLQQLAEGSVDEELRRLAAERLGAVASSFDHLANGSAYLHAYPSGAHVETVRTRLEALAQNLYGEVVLYQGLGDHVKALERIQDILEHAPMTSAAEALRERAVVES